MRYELNIGLFAVPSTRVNPVSCLTIPTILMIDNVPLSFTAVTRAARLLSRPQADVQIDDIVAEGHHVIFHSIEHSLHTLTNLGNAFQPSTKPLVRDSQPMEHISLLFLSTKTTI